MTPNATPIGQTLIHLGLISKDQLHIALREQGRSGEILGRQLVRLGFLSETTLRASSQRNALLVESLAALETVKIQGAEGSMQTKWEESTRFLAQVGSRLKVLSTSATNFAGFVQQFNSVAMLVVGVYQIMLGNLSMGG